MFWQTASADHIGGRVQQQDRVAIWQTKTGDRCLVVLADGMGGHQGGAIASQTVIDCAAELWQNQCLTQTVLDPATLLENYCSDTHDAIRAAGELHGLEPHSTCVILYIQAGQAWMCHLGDSRYYWFNQHGYQRRSKDDSIVQMLFDMGRIEENEMATHPDQSCLLKGLGGHDPVTVTCEYLILSSADSFLLCSDGLWEQISTDEMEEALIQTDLLISAQNLVKLAAERAGKRGDNVAVALICSR